MRASAGGRGTLRHFTLRPVDEAEDDGCTPLYVAACTGQDAVVQLLVQAGVAVDQTDDDGRTPLFVAAYNGQEAVVRLLLQAGADRARRPAGGETAADIAQRNGHPEVAAMLRPYLWGLFG